MKLSNLNTSKKPNNSTRKLPIDLKRRFSKEAIHIANEHRKMDLISPIREMQIKSIVRY